MRVLFSAVVLAVSTTMAVAAPCSQRIAFVHRIIDKDVQIGYVDRKVHDDMDKDLDQAAQLCKAGDDARAQAIISSTQRRHGYPVRG